MKANKFKLFLLAIMLLIPGTAKAASSCSYAEQVELNDIVANVTATYEVTDIYVGQLLAIDEVDSEGNIPEVDAYQRGIKVSILNITEDIYVRVTNNQNEEERIIYYEDTNDGVTSFETTETNVLTTYTIEVYSNKYSCIGDRFRTFTVQTPVYNRFSEKEVCKNYTDYYYCQEFILSETIDYDTFYTNLETFIESKAEEEEEVIEENKTWIERIKEFLNNNKVTILVSGCVIIGVGGLTTVILVKKKRSRKI